MLDKLIFIYMRNLPSNIYCEMIGANIPVYESVTMYTLFVM